MDGQPVWLVSVSQFRRSMRKDQPSIIATDRWTKTQRKVAEAMAHQMLEGIGDPSQERAFRMNITFCIHRAISSTEQASLPANWESTPGGLAGGPIEVLWSRGIPHRDAAMPCEAPSKQLVDRQRPDLWFPIDCGQCAPCEARKACRA